MTIYTNQELIYIQNKFNIHKLKLEQQQALIQSNKNNQINSLIYSIYSRINKST